MRTVRDGMAIDVGLVGAISSAVSTGVLIVGGGVALRQLRSARHSNELSTLTKFAELWESETLREARRFMRDDLPERMDDPSFIGELRRPGSGVRWAIVLPLLNFYEDMATYVYAGALTEKTVMLIYGGTIWSTWTRMRAAIAVVRDTNGDDVANMFEDLAMRAAAWRERSGAEFRALKRDPDMPRRRASHDPDRPPSNGR
jgi:hypothetical protein